MHALDVKLKELEVERAQAATEQAKAEAEAKIAEANRNKAYWENKMAEEAEIFKAAMLNYQTQTAQAQEAYDNAMKLIEAGKLLLSDGEKAIIDKAQQRLYVASASLEPILWCLERQLKMSMMLLLWQRKQKLCLNWKLPSK